MESRFEVWKEAVMEQTNLRFEQIPNRESSMVPA